MRDSRINYVIVGSFVLLIVAGMVGAIALLTGRTGATDTYYTHYDNVSGLKFGTQVLFEGYPIGQVDRIEPVRDTDGLTFKVAMTVEDGWPMPEGSRARPVASGLLAAKAIDIRGPDDPKAGLLESGATLAAARSGDLMQTMSDVATEVGDLSADSLRPLLDNLNRYVVTLGETLTAQAPGILTDLRTVSADLSARAPAILDDMKGVSGKLAETTPVMTDNLVTFSTNMTALSEDLKTTKAKVDGMVDTVAALVDKNDRDVSQSLDDLRYTLNAVSRHIDSLVYNLEGTSRNMFEFSRQIRENPGLLLGGTAPRDEAR